MTPEKLDPKKKEDDIPIDIEEPDDIPIDIEEPDETITLDKWKRREEKKEADKIQIEVNDSEIKKQAEKIRKEIEKTPEK